MGCANGEKSIDVPAISTADGTPQITQSQTGRGFPLLVSATVFTPVLKSCFTVLQRLVFLTSDQNNPQSTSVKNEPPRTFSICGPPGLFIFRIQLPVIQWLPLPSPCANTTNEAHNTAIQRISPVETWLHKTPPIVRGCLHPVLANVSCRCPG